MEIKIEKKKFNRVLVYNIELQSFTPWEVKDDGEDTDFVVGLFFNPFLSSQQVNSNIIVGGELVTVNSEEVIIQQYVSTTNTSSEAQFLVRSKTTGELTFAKFTSSTFKDWGTSNYESYFVPTPITMDNWILEKSPLYLVCYFDRTEQNFVSDGSTGWNLDLPSGCLVRIISDFENIERPTQQVYRFARLPLVDETDLTFNYPHDVIITRTKLRGKGKVLKIRFGSEEGKDFRLQGYEILGYLNEQV